MSDRKKKSNKLAKLVGVERGGEKTKTRGGEAAPTLHLIKVLTEHGSKAEGDKYCQIENFCLYSFFRFHYFSPGEKVIYSAALGSNLCINS